MPYIYIGKRNFFLGKRLWEIAGNLKNFGEGRILVRSAFERYPEVSYVKIIRAEPLMDEENLFGRVLVEKVFRGKSFGEFDLSKTAYKNDFKLIPKDEEEFYLSRTMKAEDVEKLKKPLPEFIQFPPLLREMISKQEKNPNPLLRAVYNCSPNNTVHVEPGKICNNKQIENAKASHLYENLNHNLQ
ncbi:28S ribosomal protein S34, mitochondrial-like [Daphnia pulicaria]|uniref:28S ribosomal protein S34, mitochondrial-like n=1 Tax=Daphnia pulicaria TaxID=35523 RepID=UPI001EEA6CE4|nr:28S ribosomal protein S34, mitochondrial-like [Daphnia pulicaria]